MSCRPVCLVSSTPHPVRKKFLPDISYNVSNVISPITQPVESETYLKCHLPVLYHKPKHGTEPAISKKYKRSAKQKKIAESASSEILRELKEKNIAVNTALSQSRNMYNMYPELVVLDSDEEDVISTVDNKNTPIKNPKEAAKIPRAKKLKKTNDEEIKAVKYEDEHLDEPPHKTRLRRSKRPELKKHELPQNNLENNKRKVTQVRKEEALQDKKQGGIRKRKCKIPQNSSTSVVCLDDESIFSDCLLPGNLSCKTKRKILQISQLVNAISDEDNVQWTPRSRTSEVKAPDEEHLDQNKNSVPQNKLIGDKTQALKINKITCDNNLVSSKESNIKIKDKRDGNETDDQKLPSDLFSCFNNIVFKHNKGSGGLVSNCLQTEKLKFGYVEVEKGQTFTGQCSNVTFVLLEGQVEAALLHTTQAMSPGDMLRINTDSGYKFKNTSTGHARFLFVREKH